MAKIEGFTDNFFDGTKALEKTYISQHPIGSEEAGKICTQPKHWELVHKEGIQIIVQVQDETGTLAAYYPKEVDDDEFPAGDYLIKNVKTSTVKGCTVRELECLHTKSNKSKKVYHIEYTGWTKHHVPDEQELLDIIELARSYGHGQKKLFHCSDGLHESIILAAIDLGIDLQSFDKLIVFDDVIDPFLETRCGCVVSPQEIVLIVLALTKAEMKLKGIDYCPSYSVLKYIYEKMQINNYYEVKLITSNYKKNLINEFKEMEARCAKDEPEWAAANPGKEICLGEINFAKYIKDVEEKPEKNTKQSRVKKSKDGKKGGQKQSKTKTTTKAKKNKSKEHKNKSRASDGKKNIPDNNKPGPSHAGKKHEIEKKSKDLSGSQQKKPKEPQQKKEVAPKLDEDGDEGSPSSTKKYNQPKKHHVARPPPPTGNSKKKKSKGK
ncbi:hypothetical protein CAEBREN_31565 [Caenorhabditis brenneri]|uniref:Tyrosine-protein phosphatase domain-containing protein n=1 Tax=Caenorhabditis brenneri TaxID=135651 RepID=G0NSC3_CAEBE|nr:hypothetical protein CAEBREN_31565 [Caenorhabditis brenneri]